MFSVTKISDIFDDIVLATIPMINDPLSILSPNNIDKRISIFRAIFKNTLREFSEYSPLVLSNMIQVSRGRYDFQDQSNYFFNTTYDKNEIPSLIEDDDIELIPKTVSRVFPSNISRMPIRAGVWKYSYPTLYITSGTYRIVSLNDYPYFFGNTLADSYVMYLDSNDFKFNRLLKYNFLSHIQDTSKVINIGEMDGFDFSSILDRLKTEIDKDKELSSSLYRASWRM